jgi:hypothetical protein
MKDHAAGVVSDEAFAKRKEDFPVDTPETKEGYFIREIFDGTISSHFIRGLPHRKGQVSSPPRRPRERLYAGYPEVIGGAQRILAAGASVFTKRLTTKLRHKGINPSGTSMV